MCPIIHLSLILSCHETPYIPITNRDSFLALEMHFSLKVLNNMYCSGEDLLVGILESKKGQWEKYVKSLIFPILQNQNDKFSRGDPR